MTIWYILCSFGTFFRFWYHVTRKIWQPWFHLEMCPNLYLECTTTINITNRFWSPIRLLLEIITTVIMRPFILNTMYTLCMLLQKFRTTKKCSHKILLAFKSHCSTCTPIISRLGILNICNQHYSTALRTY
jgi:hypothetical protein